MNELIDACYRLLMFTKHNEFPERNTDGFFELTQKLDEIETVMLKHGYVTNKTLRANPEQKEARGK